MSYQFSGSKRRRPAEDALSREIFSIRIPFSGMLNKEQIIYKCTSTSSKNKPNPRRSYRLIDGVPSGTEIRIRKSYVMSFDNRTMNAEWVYEILNKSTLPERAERDPNCSKQMSFGTNTFNDEDYHQGHLAAAANHTWCMEAYHDTYLMSNMAPQLRDLNNSVWKILENYCRDRVMEDNVRNVHVYTGPLYLSDKKLTEALDTESESEDENLYRSDPSREERLGGKVKPTHFFKVVIVENNDGTVEEPDCYRMPNTNPEYKKTSEKYKTEMPDIQDNFNFLSSYRKHIDVIEAQSGLKFIERRPNVDLVELHTITLTGEHKNGELCRATIDVRCLFQA